MSNELTTGRIAPALHEVISKFGVNWQGAKDVIFSPMWDLQPYPAAGVQVMNFFAVQESGTKTRSDTNMQLAGQIPQPEIFLATALYVAFASGAPVVKGAQATAANVYTAADDLLAFYESGNLEFRIGTKDYASGAPLALFPPPYRFAADFALSDATTAAASLLTVAGLARICGDVMAITPIEIPPGQGFGVSLKWPEGVLAMPSGVDGRVGVGLLGYRYRPVQ